MFFNTCSIHCRMFPFTVELLFVDSFFLKNCGRILLIQQGIQMFIVRNLCCSCQGIVQRHLVMFQKMSKNMFETYSA